MLQHAVPRIVHDAAILCHLSATSLYIDGCFDHCKLQIVATLLIWRTFLVQYHATCEVQRNGCSLLRQVHETHA